MQWYEKIIKEIKRMCREKLMLSSEGEAAEAKTKQSFSAKAEKREKNNTQTVGNLSEVSSWQNVCQKKYKEMKKSYFYF